MRIPYHEANNADYERLIVAICAEILGPGVQPFSSGPDGGRDARFHGRASKFPSVTAPHDGKFVIQAKHTEHPFAKFSDTEFSSDALSSDISLEIPKIKRLVDEQELEFYYLFSNRRLAGEADAQLRARIRAETGAATVELFGIERMDLLLKMYPGIERVADLRALSSPLIPTSDDLAEVITALDREKGTFAEAFTPIDEVRRVSFQRKNIINRLAPEFAEYIRRSYLPDFATVKRFLASPANAPILERYNDAATEFHELILAHRGANDTLDQTLVRLQYLLTMRDGDLARRKRLTKLVLYYMYWNCDMGETEE